MENLDLTTNEHALDDVWERLMHEAPLAHPDRSAFLTCALADNIGAGEAQREADGLRPATGTPAPAAAVAPEAIEESGDRRRGWLGDGLRIFRRCVWRIFRRGARVDEGKKLDGRARHRGRHRRHRRRRLRTEDSATSPRTLNS